MNPFMSLPNKVVLLLLALLLSLSMALSMLWLQKTNQDFALKQEEIRQQNRSQYLLLNSMLQTRIESWVELLSQLHQSEEDHLQALGKTFIEKYEYLQLNFQVEGLWLFDDKQQPVFQSQDILPDYVLGGMKAAQSQLTSINSIHCQDACYQIMSIPVLLNTGATSVVTLRVGLIDTLAFLNQSTQATLAVVHSPARAEIYKANNLFIRGPLAKKQLQIIGDLIDRFPDDLLLEELLSSGAQVTLNDKSYFVVMLPMSTINEEKDFLFSAYDISLSVTAHESYQLRILITALAVFTGALLLFYFMTNNIRRRLNRLASRLPLLAQRKYELFRQQNTVSNHHFRDELDALNDSANQLADQLEQLDAEVMLKTNELQRIAMFDQLTHLPNRNMLLARTQEALAKLRPGNGQVVLLLFDLDDFKKVNDSYGHSVGDELLSEAAARFQSVVRSSDIACRLGGDEFAILLQDIKDEKGAVLVAEKLLDRFRSPINVGSLRFYVSTSIGLAFADDPSAQVTEMIRWADIAMYLAKSRGGNCYEIYDESMSQKAIDKVALEDEARGALIHDHFSFALQPQIEIGSGKLVGFEALLRWEHPERGQVSPGYFIPILENTEFMLTLGYWCIENAFDLLCKFREQGYGHLKIAINLAGIQFLDPDLIPYLEEKIKETGLSPDLVELELTERTLVSDVSKTTSIMRELIDKGFMISIDDFGTGYSSLSYLKDMPAHFIKIDRAFIDGMLRNEADKQIVFSTVAMVQNLKMKVIAEGIEEASQIDILRQVGCDMGQGYCIAKPIPQDQLFEQLKLFLKDNIWQY